MRLLAIAIAPTLLAGVGFGQNFNIDVGGAPPLHGTPLPASTFGAAAGQPGVWTAVDPAPGIVATSLVDLTGSATGVTMTRTAGNGLASTGGIQTSNPQDDALMGDRDLAFASTGSTWTLNGLAAGTYHVYSYAMCLSDSRTGVSINGGPVTSVGGVWTGAYTLGVTHALDTVTVASGGSIAIQTTYLSGFLSGAYFNGLQITRNTSTSSFCDGSALGTACLACGNNGAADNGCANSGFSAGGHLASSGVAGASSGTDTLALTATNITGPALFLQASGVAATPVSFGDGDLCATAGITRMGVVFPVAGSASYPGGSTPLPIHTVGATTPGDIRHYQCWYRDALSFCTAATFNLTQGLTIAWE